MYGSAQLKAITERSEPASLAILLRTVRARRPIAGRQVVIDDHMSLVNVEMPCLLILKRKETVRPNGDAVASCAAAWIGCLRN